MTRTRSMTAAAALLMASQAALGQSTNWTNGLGGNYSTPTNWSAGVPTSSGQARFSLAGAYTVSFDASATVVSTTIDTGVVTFALNGRDLTMANLTVSPFSGNPGSSLPLLRLSGGRLNTSTAGVVALELRDAALFNATSTVAINRSLSISGAGSTFTGGLTLGGSVSGASTSQLVTLDITNGGAFVSGSTLTAGDTSGAFHEITVEGPNSTLGAGGLTIGQSGSASLVVSNGGAARVNSSFGGFASFRAATSLASTATILIDNGTLQYSEVVLGGTSATSSGTVAGNATMTVRNGGVAVAGSAGATNSTTTLAIFTNSALDLEDGTLRGTGAVRVEGVLRGGGLVSLGLTNASNGRVLIAAGKRLRNGSTNQWTNNGLLTLDNGSQLDAGVLNNEFGGLVTARNGATIENRSTINRGSIAFTAGHVDVLGRLDNNTPGAIVTLSNGATATFYDDVTSSGKFNLNAGSSATFLGAFNAFPSGSITGTGTTIFEGDLRPGSPAGVGALSVGGDLNLGSSSTLSIELGGLQRGTDYDAIDVGGTLGLNGSISVSKINGFVPLPGDVFDIAHFASSTGDAAVTNATGFAGLSFVKTIGANALTLQADATGGDANLDAIVNFDDLVVLAQHYGVQSGENWLDGDFTQDSRVDFDDLVLLAQNYGAATPAAFATDWALAQSLVPEPTLMVGGAFLVVPFMRRRSR